MITDDLDLGERAAVAPAGTVHAGLLLIDEAAGRLDETLSSAVFDRWLQP